MLSLVLTALSILPTNDVVRESCDLLEVNHFYDEQGRLVFDQFIAWDWDGSRFQVRAWRLIKHESQIPQRDHKHGGYVATWNDGDVTRSVRSGSMRETWLQHDPALADREYLEKEKRRELKRSNTRKPAGQNPAD